MKPLSTTVCSLGRVAVLLTVCLSSPALAQQRPLVTEDPESIGSGLVLVEGDSTTFETSPIRSRGLKAIG